MKIETDKISDNIIVVRGANKGRFPYSNSFLIQGEKCALIDTGCGVEILKGIKKRFNIDFIINSHTHPDHVAGNWVFEGYDIWSPLQTRDVAGRLDKLAKRFVGVELAESWKEIITGFMDFKEYTPTHFFDKEYLFDLGDIKLRAIHTPGHLDDHYCFFIDEEKILLSFDIDFTSFGPWYGHEESNIIQFIESIKKVWALKPKIILSGHRNIIRENIDGEFERYLEIFEERDRRILDFLAEERSLENFINKSLIYGDYPYAKEILEYWEGQMILKHLKILEEKGYVERIDRDGKTFFKKA